MHSLQIFLIAVSSVIALLAIYTLRFRSSGLGYTYFGLLVAIFIYSLGYAFEIEATTVESIYGWLRFEYLGIAWLPTIFLILAFQYTGQQNLLKPWFLIGISIISITTIVLQFTNWNNLFYTELAIDSSGPFPVSGFKKGIWYWIHQVYSNLSFLISSFVYLNMFLSSRGINKMRAGIMLFTAIIPWGFYAIYLTGHSPNHIDLNPLSVAAVGILAALGLFRFQLLEFEPMALDSVFQSIDEGVIIIDTNKRLLKYNEHTHQLFPAINENLIGKNIESTLSPYFDLNTLLENNTDHELETKTGSQHRFYQVRAFVIKATPKRNAGWTIILTDITRRKETETILQENAKTLKEIDTNRNRFIAILAHDLRNPLHIMINLSDLLVSKLPENTDNAVKKMAQNLYDTSYSITHLTENLLRWAQLIRSGIQFNPQTLSLEPLVKQEIKFLNPLFERKKIYCKLDIAPDTEVYADAEMLRTIIRNLTTNAIKFSQECGNVEIKATNLENVVQIEVKDYGVGIAEEEQKKLFQIDNYITQKGTRSETGSGLGLVISKEFIDKHNGSIWVISKPEQGSTFIFTLPDKA
ncbi:MAG TPA: histidine kinase N-terminal 7TM domain-containing protein [Bacteroidales bacterium]|nr:histidine kinase N-terminal 7TM domain-containing protein [Bacteroidales bacterium]